MTRTRLSNAHAAVRQINAHVVAVSPKAVGTGLLALGNRALHGS